MIEIKFSNAVDKHRNREMLKNIRFMRSNRTLTALAFGGGGGGKGGREGMPALRVCNFRLLKLNGPN